MKIGRSKEQAPEINITSLIDVVFLLLIFFMVSTTFDKQSQLSIQLPKATTLQEKNNDEVIEIIIDAKKRITIDSQMLTDNKLATIRQALLQITNNDINRSIILKADAHADHELVVRVMDAVAREGFSKLGIATSYEEDN